VLDRAKEISAIMRCRTRVVPLRTVNESLNGDAMRGQQRSVPARCIGSFVEVQRRYFDPPLDARDDEERPRRLGRSKYR
jgi:hypothetical protein